MNNKNYLNSMQTISEVNGSTFSPPHHDKKQARKKIESKAQDEQKEIIRRLKIQNKKLMEQVISLKDQLKQTKKNRDQVLIRLNSMHKLNKALSDALGSCNICWGNDPECPACSGNGYSGWRNVNKRLFNIYILPVLEKIYGINLK